MFKPETIEKIKNQMVDLFNHYSNKRAEDIPLALSVGNRKIGRVMNVSLAPLLTCLSAPCFLFCYDVKACLQYVNVRDARVRNTVLAIKYPDVYFSRIRERLSRRRTNKYFRWHVGGDIPTASYFAEMVKIAREFPDFTFWTYTKKYHIVNAYVKENGRAAIPENLHIMFSEWDGMPLVNPYDFPIFTVRLKGGNKNHPAEWFSANCFKCCGNCDICKAHKCGCIAGMNTYVDEH